LISVLANISLSYATYNNIIESEKPLRQGEWKYDEKYKYRET
jgi:hypothetical protein